MYLRRQKKLIPSKSLTINKNNKNSIQPYKQIKQIEKIQRLQYENKLYKFKKAALDDVCITNNDILYLHTYSKSKISNLLYSLGQQVSLSIFSLKLFRAEKNVNLIILNKIN